MVRDGRTMDAGGIVSRLSGCSIGHLSLRFSDLSSGYFGSDFYALFLPKIPLAHLLGSLANGTMAKWTFHFICVVYPWRIYSIDRTLLSSIFWPSRPPKSYSLKEWTCKTTEYINFPFRLHGKVEIFHKEPSLIKKHNIEVHKYHQQIVCSPAPSFDSITRYIVW